MTRTLVIEMPKPVLGVISPYPTVVMVTTVSHRACGNDSMSSRSSTAYISEAKKMACNNKRMIMTGKISIHNSIALLHKRLKLSKRRIIFSRRSTGTTQSSMKRTGSLSSLSSGGTMPVAMRSARAGAALRKSMRLAHMQKKVQGFALTHQCTKTSSKKTASKLVSSTAGKRPEGKTGGLAVWRIVVTLLARIIAPMTCA
mmetsp:Transcript_100051/g.174495  ORF Transcript_100051/g.174495 Transcript_100051/m.174495 type:complete len:200 (-) Transcript_100051:6-605(-)